MSTAIEAFLYRDMGVHGVVDIRIAGDVIDLTVAPFEDLTNTFAVRFAHSKLLYIDSSYSDSSDDWSMPWDIIGFDSEPKAGQWGFCLHSDVVELAFVADWPVPVASDQLGEP